MKSSFKVKLFKLNRKRLWCIIISSFLVFALSVILAGSASPEVLKTKEISFKTCNESETFNCISERKQQSYIARISDINIKNFFIYLKLSSDTSSLNNIEVYYKVSLSVDKSTLIENRNLCNFSNNSVALSHIIPLIKENTGYIIEFTIYSSFSKNDTLTLSVTYLYEEFFDFLVSVKYFFFCYSLFWLVYFFYSTRAVKFRYLSFETYTLVFMNFSLLIFDEPLIGSYVDMDEITFIVISVFCNVQFMCCLVLYWLFMLKKINNPYCQKIITTVELVFVCSLFAFMFIIYVYLGSNLKDNLNFNWTSDLEASRKVIYQVLIFVIVLFGFWVLVLILMSLKKWKGEQLSKREKFYWGFNYGLIVMSFVFIGMGYFQLMNYGKIVLSVSALYNLYFTSVLYFFTPDLKSYRNWINENYQIGDLD